MAMRGDGVRHHPWLIAGVVVGVVALVALAFVLAMPEPHHPAPKIDRDSAVILAREHFGATYPGAKVTEVTVEDATLGSDASGRTVWRVTIHGDVASGGGTARTSMILSVDAENGAVTVLAQG